MANDMVYHYTSLDVLALILANRTIRFNNLCNLDDTFEKYVKSISFGNSEKNDGQVNLGRYCFVSCWSTEEESISMWDMYGDRKKGVRIGLPKDMFQSITTLYPKSESHPLFNYDTPIKEYAPDFFNIEYDRLQESDPSILSENWKEGLDNLGKHKIPEWAFQKECRFRIFAYLDSKAKVNRYFSMEMEGFNPTGSSGYIGEEYLDLYLKDDVFSQMEITIGPKMPKERRIFLIALANKFNINETQIYESKFVDEEELKSLKLKSKYLKSITFSRYSTTK